MNILNLTSHTVVLSNGTRYEPTGVVARVNIIEKEREPFNLLVHGAVEGLPSPKRNTYYIVSAVVAKECRHRRDLLCPNTKKAIRDENGQVQSVPNLIKYV